MNPIFIESGHVSLIKYNEELCGDCVVYEADEDTATVVLSDGLGSGVKANILSTLTAKIIATMISHDMPIEECVETIANTLPVCSARGVAYSTFSILQVNKSGDAHLIQFDNPEIIILRNGKSLEYQSTQKVTCNKKIFETSFKVEIGDVFILMSDGAIHAGIGRTLNFGWERKNIIEYAEKKYYPEISAKAMAGLIAEACRDLYMNLPGDDTTIAALKIRTRKTINLMIGPPEHRENDEDVFNLFFSKEGKKIVCGGSTSQAVARFLETEVVACLDYMDKEIPPTAKIKGVDLVTEGVITIGKVLELAQSFTSNTDFSSAYKDKKDGASQIAKLLFEEATDINFFVGKAINPSHQNPNLPTNIDYNIKRHLITSLAEHLERMGKKVKINYN